MLCSPVRRRSICKLEFVELLLDLVRQRHLQSRAIGAYTSSRRGATAQSSCASGRCCVRRSRLHLGPYASALGSRVSSTVEPQFLVAEQRCAFRAAFEPGTQFCSHHRVAFEPDSQLRSVTLPQHAAADIAAFSFDDGPAHWYCASSYIGAHCQPAHCCTDCGGKGYITHGDGHRTACPCPASCKCKSPTGAVLAPAAPARPAGGR